MIVTNDVARPAATGPAALEEFLADSARDAPAGGSGERRLLAYRVRQRRPAPARLTSLSATSRSRPDAGAARPSSPATAHTVASTPGRTPALLMADVVGEGGS